MADRTVPVATAANEMIAGMVAGLLTDEGIRCATKNVGAAVGYGAPVFDPHQIIVLEADAPRAAGVLAEYAGPELTLLVAPPRALDDAAPEPQP